MTPPHIRTPEAWLEEVAHPLYPAVRPHALEPWRKQIAARRAEGASDAEIVRELGDTLEAQSDITALWPTRRQIAEWCNPPRQPWQVLWLPALLLVLLAAFMLLMLSPLIGLEWSIAGPILLSWAVIVAAAGYAVWPLLGRKLTREEGSRLYDVALYLVPSMVFALQSTPDTDALFLVGLTIYTACVAWAFVRRARTVGQPVPSPPNMQRLQQAGVQLEDLCEDKRI